MKNRHARDYVQMEMPGLTVRLLDYELDPALLGWVQRGDLPATPAYELEQFVLLATGIWKDPEKVVKFLATQSTSKTPDVVFVDVLPTRAEWWRQVREGMIAWDQLNAAAIGLAQLRGEGPIAVYDARRAEAELRGAIEDSSSLGDGLREFFERDIQGARLGDRTPLMLHTEREWPANNGLGAERGRGLPPLPMVPEPPATPEAEPQAPSAPAAESEPKA